MTPIRILLVDDHAVVRSGLGTFLMVNQDMELVAEATDGAEAIQMANLHTPDVILMDLMMPGMDGITATRAIHQKYPQIKIIALTSFSEQNLVQEHYKPGKSVICKKMSLPWNWLMQSVLLTRGG